MNSLRKLERDHTAADLASVEAMIDRLTDEDVMMRLGLEERRDELRRKLEALQAEDEPTASAALFFSGRPVVGGRGIESEFGGKAVQVFQDLVAKQFAQDAGGLGQRGVVPNKAATRLHITNVVRGSFGFLLEELDSQVPLLNSTLKTAVDHVSRLIAAFSEDDEERFEAVVETADERVLATARDFFSLVRQDGATFRIVVGELDRSFDLASVERAAERANVTTLEDRDERIAGVLTGVLPETHMFEFRCEGVRGVIKGKVDKEIPATDLAIYNRDWLDRPSLAVVTIRKVLKRGATVRESFTLKGLLPPEVQNNGGPMAIVRR
jgi:hypothetical protein